MRNPNGYGTVAKLSGKRRKPFIVKKVVGWDENDHPIYDIVGYTATREEGNILLAEYNKDPWDVDRAKITLKQLYELWQERKAPKMSTATCHAMRTAYKHCHTLYDRPYKLIKAFQMQDCLDNCGNGHSSQASIKNLWWHLDRFAKEMDINVRGYSDLLVLPPTPVSTRDRFSDEQIELLWEHSAEPWVDTVLIFIYSGWRISELLAIPKSDVDLVEMTMKGGTKTDAGKNRIVPIHSLIQPFIIARMEEPGPNLLNYDGKPVTTTRYRSVWNQVIKSLGIDKTPHECRHTFESLLDNAGANRKCIDLMVGHASKDTGQRIYTHKTIDDLRFNLELVTR